MRHHDDEQIITRMGEIRGLLSKFGLTLSGFDPGVLAWKDQATSFNFDREEWAWLEPLLKELSRYRQQSTTHDVRLRAALETYLTYTSIKVIEKWARESFGDDYLGDPVNRDQIKRLICLVDQCFKEPAHAALAWGEQTVDVLEEVRDSMAIPRTVRRSAETDAMPCAVCGHTENEFKAAQIAGGERVLVDTKLVVVPLHCASDEAISEPHAGLPLDLSNIDGVKIGDTVRVIVVEEG